jgi:hypothetical protein
MDLHVAVKPGLCGAPAGAIAVDAVSGFGWSTITTSATPSRDCAGVAVVTAPEPFRVTKVEADPGLTVLEKLQTVQSSYSRHDIVVHAGWATLGSGTMANDDLARACADKLYMAKAG